MTPLWKHTGNGWYQFNEERCYPGTQFFIVRNSNGRYFLRLINDLNTPQTDVEVSRRRGQVDSEKIWKTPSGAKRAGRPVARNLRWLRAAGIEFKSGTFHV